MTRLAPDLFQRRFQDLMEIGRARLREYAPEWTDHNAHDPGITLMELLAWVAEAQLYSLSRMRRDERTAYAALLGIVPEGTQAARGLVWPDHHDPRTPVATYVSSVVIPTGAIVNVLDAETPTFQPEHKLLWAPGRIVKLESRLANGRRVNHTAINERGGPAFLPFGETAGQHDVLAMTFQCRGDSGLFPARRAVAQGARWSVGVRADVPLTGASAGTVDLAPIHESPLTATLVAGDERFRLAIVSDTTHGLLTTGVLVLDLDNLVSSPREFTLELHSPNGFARPPRLLCIEPNVVPIIQSRFIDRELHVANGQPDFGFDLDMPGLTFGDSAQALHVEVHTGAERREWTRCYQISQQGPDDCVYELDTKAGRITFGNGLNGRMPAVDAQIFVSYRVSDGEQGIAARNRKWQVAGFQGAFGVNPDPITGGAAPSGWIDQRREARRRVRHEHALVSSDDITTAALALPLLEVVRAWVLVANGKAPRTGMVTLVAMRARPFGKEPMQTPETRRWCEAVRRCLVTRMPLGSRLIVTAPRYVEFFIRAAITAEPGRDPLTIKKDVENELSKRLALVESDSDMPPRQPGIPVTRRDLIAWLRKIEGVKQVVDLQLVSAGGNDIDEIKVPRGGLPRFRFDRSTIEINRAGSGSGT